MRTALHVYYSEGLLQLMASFSSGVQQRVLWLLPWQTLTAFWPPLLAAVSVIDDSTMVHSDSMSLTSHIIWEKSIAGWEVNLSLAKAYTRCSQTTWNTPLSLPGKTVQHPVQRKQLTKEISATTLFKPSLNIWTQIWCYNHKIDH